MRLFLRRLFCKHLYVSVSTYEKDLDHGVGYKKGSFHIIYCPKCRDTKEVLDYEYQKINRIQEIDRQYQNNEID